MSETPSSTSFRNIPNRLVRSTLLCVPLFDELFTGFEALGIPLMRERLSLSPAEVLWLLGLSTIISMILEPLAALLSDIGSKRVWILVSMPCMALGYFLLGLAHDFWLALIALCILNTGGKLAIGLSQAALIDLAPQESTQAMTRWTLLGGVGDLLAPLLVPTMIGLAFGWTVLCWGAALLWLLASLVLSTQRFGGRNIQPQKQESKGVTLMENLREALTDPVMIRWAVLSLVPSMVDEVFQSVITLYLHDVLHTSNVMISLLLSCAMVSSLLSLLILDRWRIEQHVAPAHLLRWLAFLVLAGFLLLLTQQTLWLVGLALVLINMGAAGWYPISKAQAYARFPGRSGTVRAITSLGAPLEMSLPNVVGAIIGVWGIVAGIGALGLAPCFVLLLTLGDRKLNKRKE